MSGYSRKFLAKQICASAAVYGISASPAIVDLILDWIRQGIYVATKLVLKTRHSVQLSLRKCTSAIIE